VASPCARVVGRVVGAQSWWVSLRAGEFKRVTFVDASGRFAFEHVPPLQNASVGGSGVFDVPAGAVVNVVLPEVEACLVEGVVRDASGNPVEGAVVLATHMPYGFMAMKMIQIHSPQMDLTDKAGRFSIRMVVGARKRGTIVVRSLDHAPARSDWFKPIANERVEVAVTLGAGAAIRGRALDAKGQPLRNALVQIDTEKMIDDAAWDESAFTDANGRFHFAHIAVGTYELRMYCAGAVLARTIRTGPTPVELRFTHGGFIEGVIVDAHDRPEGGFGVSVLVDETHGFVNVGADGRFRISNLAPGMYNVVAWSIGGSNKQAVALSVPTGTKDLRLRLR